MPFTPFYGIPKRYSGLGRIHRNDMTFPKSKKMVTIQKSEARRTVNTFLQLVTQLDYVSFKSQVQRYCCEEKMVESNVT